MRGTTSTGDIHSGARFASEGRRTTDRFTPHLVKFAKYTCQLLGRSMVTSRNIPSLNNRQARGEDRDQWIPHPYGYGKSLRTLYISLVDIQRITGVRSRGGRTQWTWTAFSH